MKDQDTIILLAEKKRGQISEGALELAGAAMQLACATRPRIVACVLGAPSSEQSAQLFASGVDEIVVCVEGAESHVYTADIWLAVLDKLQDERKPRVVLAASDADGNETLARFGARRGLGVALGCESAVLCDNGLSITRACFGNNARETLIISSATALVSIKRKAFEKPQTHHGRTGTVSELKIPEATFAASPVVTSRAEPSDTDGIALDKAKVIVAGGRGIGSADGFRPLNVLARLLGGTVGASRVACDMGWCPHSWQIGLTGKTVTPDLYIAVGISGASHHMAGCGQSKTIVAINGDDTAPIFSQAHFGIVGDCNDIVPAVIEALEKRKASS